MVEAIRHRGPDASGFVHDADYHAGMCRLAINDVSGGDQPLYSSDRNVVLLYNGEIYNYPQLRRELEGQGHVFRSSSDGEVICHLYARYGEGLFERLDGMFAVALWISSERKLILARDLPGEKPLYYSEPRPSEIVFASEIKGLKRFGGLCDEINRQALWDYPTFLWIPEPDTVYRNVKALPRGHILVHQNGAAKISSIAKRFGEAYLKPGSAGSSVVERTRRIVEDAVKSRLLSDVPLGSFLSGGLDSSIVATIAAREMSRLDTFSIGFEDIDDPYHGRADETAAAARTAQSIGARHHIIRVTASDFLADLDLFCRHGDQPFAVSSGLGILSVARAAQQAGIKVLLSGDGADENFGGYSWYAHLRSAMDPGGTRNSGDVVSFQNIGLSLEERLAEIRSMAGPEQAWAWHYYAHEGEKQQLFSSDFQDGLATSLRHFDEVPQPLAWQPIDFIQHDRRFYFPFEMLTKVDRMTMAFSVEGRVPFAAPAVMAHAASLSYEDCVSGDGTLKVALRRAFADILSEEVVQRPKHGFNVPIDYWLKGEWQPLMQEAFAPSSALMKSGICAPGARDVAHRLLHDARRLNGHAIFSLIMLNRWLELN